MKKHRRLILALALLAALLAGLCACPAQTGAPATVPAAVESAAPSPDSAPSPDPRPSPTADPKGNTESLDEDGSYDSKEDVALYLRTYGQLPGNYITKEEAEALGWPGGNLERYAPGMCIGGDRFSNREGLLPKAKGRVWRECDIGTLGENSRGTRRIVYSNDGLIYYTDDHYESFEPLYDGT